MNKQPNEEVMTPAQVASMIDCSTRTVRRLAKQKGLPYHKVGRAVRYLRTEVEDWIRGNK